MPEKRNFFSGRIPFVRKAYDKIRFALLGTSLALPATVFNTCTGSCGNCYRCIASAAPIGIIATVLIIRKIKAQKVRTSKI